MRFLSVTTEIFKAYGINSYEEDIKNELLKRAKNYKYYEIEVGSGNGKFLVEHACEREEVFFIGIEQSLKAVNRSIKKAAKRNLKNIVFILGRAERILAESLKDNITFDVLYLNFPDPWPKKKHLKRRIVDENFIKSVHEVLKNEGTFYLVTDDENYAREHMSPYMERSPLFENQFSEKWLHKHDGYKVTLYEEKMRALGKEIHYLKYRKV